MSEEEAIKILKNKHIYFDEYEAVEDYETEDAIKIILELYQAEKEKNKFIINENLDDKYEEVLEKVFKKYIDKEMSYGYIIKTILAGKSKRLLAEKYNVKESQILSDYNKAINMLRKKFNV